MVIVCIMNDLLRPLRKMVERYDKHERLNFEEVKRQIADCQQLLFMADNASHSESKSQKSLWFL